MRLGQDCPRELWVWCHAVIGRHVSMRLGQDCPREFNLLLVRRAILPGFNEAGARLPQRVRHHCRAIERYCAVSMRLGQDCPREVTALSGPHWPGHVSMRLGQDCPRESRKMLTGAGRNFGFNEAGARLPQRALDCRTHHKEFPMVSMRLGQDCPRESSISIAPGRATGTFQ